MATRLAWELFALSSDYTRVVTNLWLADSQGMQLGLLAPGWVHGCLGLHFIFSRRPWYRQGRYGLFAVALRWLTRIGRPATPKRVFAPEPGLAEQGVAR